MKVAIATDHNGVEEKKELIALLHNKNIQVIDCSTDNTPIDDYPDYALKVSHCVTKGEALLGVLLCGTGIGMSIAANKIKGIRCAKVSSIEDAHLSREHNNANIVALSYKEPIEELKKMVLEFIETPFSEDERHVRRIDKISKMEQSYDN